MMQTFNKATEQQPETPAKPHQVFKPCRALNPEIMGNWRSAPSAAAVRPTTHSSSSNRQSTEPDVPTVKRSCSLEWLPPDMSEVKVVLLGNSWSQRSSVELGENMFDPENEPF